MVMVATTVTESYGVRTMTYHRTVVAKLDHGLLTLNTGGWLTPTTKKRMNQFFEIVGLNLSVYQHNFEWFLENGATGVITQFEGEAISIRLW